jgi:hypothetical protein
MALRTVTAGSLSKDRDRSRERPAARAAWLREIGEAPRRFFSPGGRPLGQPPPRGVEAAGDPRKREFR